MVNNYKQLVVYKRMLEFVVLVYFLTKKLPNDEKFGLISQMRRAVVSVISNFAEGYSKQSVKEKCHFLEMSNTSLCEIEAQADVCRVLEYWSEGDLLKFLNKKSEVGYLLHRYTLKVKS